MRMRPLVAVLLLAIAPSAARADSDGYYCTGPGYVAWQTRLDDAGAGHQLHIVRFSAARGIERRAPIALDDFQLHGMTCNADTVVLHGWTTRYTVTVTDSLPATVERSAAPFDPTTRLASNLGHWSRPGINALESDGGADEFVLVISRTSRPVRGGIEHYTFTSIVRRGLPPAAPSVIESLEIFRGMFLETVH